MSNCKTCSRNIGRREPAYHYVLYEACMHLTVGCIGLKLVAINGLKDFGNHAYLFCDYCINRRKTSTDVNNCLPMYLEQSLPINI